MSTFNDLFSQHAGVALARQLEFADFIGDRNWSVKLPQGICTFGSDLQFPLQLLGSEADGDSTWLWAWANEASHLPPPLLKSCTALRELGKQLDVRELHERKFSLDVANGHSLALVASGIDGQCCYYRGPYDGGALFFLVKNVPAQLLSPVRSERAITVLSEVISQFEVNHRLMAESFLKAQQFTLQSGPTAVKGVRGSDSILLEFDRQQRIASIKGTIQPETPPKKWWQFWKA